GDRQGSIPVTIPQGSASGTWKVWDVTVLDYSSNTSDYDDVALATYDATRAFTVTKTADTTGPTLGTVSLPGSGIDVTLEDKQVALSAQITDTVPGFDHGTITMDNGLGDTRDFSFSR